MSRRGILLRYRLDDKSHAGAEYGQEYHTGENSSVGRQMGLFKQKGQDKHIHAGHA